jgi:hypothetical protein
MNGLYICCIKTASNDCTICAQQFFVNGSLSKMEITEFDPGLQKLVATHYMVQSIPTLETLEKYVENFLIKKIIAHLLRQEEIWAAV